nr:MFS transporter [Vicinamibacterales bacterium]
MLVLGFFAFLAFGVVLVLVGANQAALAQALDMDLAGSGLLGAALALGAGVGVTGAGPIVDRFPRRPLFVASALLAAAALLTIHPGVSYARAFAHLVVLGVGVGFYDTLLNAVVIQRSGAAAARPLALLHAGATAGAVAGPFLVAALSRIGDWTGSFHATGWALVGLALWAACVPLPAPARHREASAGAG